MSFDDIGDFDTSVMRKNYSSNGNPNISGFIKKPASDTSAALQKT